MDTIKKLLKKEIVRYVIAGVATTVVNIVSFYLLRMFTGLSRNGANVIAISLAILFAFFANKFFVFTESSKKDAVTLSREFISFVGTRLLAMLVEVVGTNLLCDSFRCNEFLSKIIIQFFVVVINYVFGKCFVFKKKKAVYTVVYEEELYYSSCRTASGLFPAGGMDSRKNRTIWRKQSDHGGQPASVPSILF